MEDKLKCRLDLIWDEELKSSGVKWRFNDPNINDSVDLTICKKLNKLK